MPTVYNVSARSIPILYYSETEHHPGQSLHSRGRLDTQRTTKLTPGPHVRTFVCIHFVLISVCSGPHTCLLLRSRWNCTWSCPGVNTADLSRIGALGCLLSGSSVTHCIHVPNMSVDASLCRARTPFSSQQRSSSSADVFASSCNCRVDADKTSKRLLQIRCTQTQGRTFVSSVLARTRTSREERTGVSLRGRDEPHACP